MEFYKIIEKKIIEDCEKYGFNCIDTSINREEIFNNLLENIKMELK